MYVHVLVHFNGQECLVLDCMDAFGGALFAETNKGNFSRTD